MFSRPDPVIAVRWQCNVPRSVAFVPLPGCAIWSYVDAANYAYHAGAWAIHFGVLLSFCFVFLVFHASVYLSDRARKENLLYCVTLALAFVSMLSFVMLQSVQHELPHLVLHHLYWALIVATSLSGFALFHVVASGTVSLRSFLPACALGIAAIALSWTVHSFIAHGFAFLLLFDCIWLYATRIWRRLHGSAIFTVGMTCLILGFAVDAFDFFSGSVTEEDAYRTAATWYGFCLLMLCVSVFLARQFAISMRDLQALRQTMLDHAESDQRHFGQDLHDGLIQHLSGVHFMVQLLHKRLAQKNVPDETAQAAEVARLLSESLSEARALARGLCPVELESGGLCAALDTLASHVRSAYGVPCELKCRPSFTLGLAVPVETAMHVYRIAQEAVYNAAVHGGPEHISIALTAGDWECSLVVTDDGHGFDPPSNGRAPAACGLGIRSMRYRAEIIGAAFTIQRVPAGGTRVCCTWRQSAA